jgi:hypothetical protein
VDGAKKKKKKGEIRRKKGYLRRKSQIFYGLLLVGRNTNRLFA